MLFACGARTELGTGGGDESDASAPDSGVIRDASIDTAPPPDTSVVMDSGPPRSCGADRECPDGLSCIADVSFVGEDLEPVPLVCGRRFAGAEDGELCDDAADCQRALCVVAGSCVPPCIDDTDCGAMERCTPVLAHTSALALQPYDGCVSVHDAPDDVVAVVDERPGALSRREAELRLERLDTMGPTTWVITTGVADLEIDLPRLTGPGGEVLFDERTIDFGSAPPINPVVPRARGTASVLLPNSPRVPSAGTTYALTARSRDRADAVVAAFGVDGSRRRRIDLDLFYVGGGDLRPAGSRGSRIVAEGLADAERLLGIEIVDVRQHEVVGGTRAALAILEEGPDGDLPALGELFRLSAGAARPSLNVFFVRQAGMALGVSGGIPGPAPMHGTEASGIVIAADFLDLPGIELGQVLAHELGHHLGLFHTTELNGLVLEPLEDTLECRAENDADGDGIVGDFECRDFGADNLMFWAGSGDELTADQQVVIHRSPAAH
jgi:hypothetical protein